MMVGTKQFSRSATKLRNQMWWQNFRWKLACAIIILAIIGLIIGLSIHHHNQKSK